MKVRSSKHRVETAAERTKGKERSQSVKRERGGQVELKNIWSPCSQRTRQGLKSVRRDLIKLSTAT